MRKNGWQLPYHPLQVVAVAVFLALGFAFYVFFAPFVGKKMFQYVVMGLYTPLIICVFSLYIWCAAADPADSGVFKSKKYLKIPDSAKHSGQKESKLGGDSTPSLHDADAIKAGDKPLDEDTMGKDATSKVSTIDIEKDNTSPQRSSCLLLACSPCAYICNCSGSSEESSSLQMSEEGMFYCSLCEVEVYKYSKHCRVCDKCVDRFDHHCRWLNNCIGKKNYRQFFTLMVSALLLLILQWTTGLLVLICCFLERQRFSMEISTKLGSSFSMAPFVIVVALCTLLAMIATLPLAQLFFFHILLIKKGISTYDYIIALREQEQEQNGVGGQHSPQMSPASSLTGLSSASSFTTFHRGAWCTPPRLFLEDQFDVVPPETGSVSSLGKKAAGEETIKKKNSAAVKISPWTLARLNAEEISKAAAEARKKSKILQPVMRSDASYGLEAGSSFGSSGRRMVPRPDNNRRRTNKRVRLPAELPMEPLTKISAIPVTKGYTDMSSSLAPLQLEARSAFQTSHAMTSSAGIVASSPESSLDSPDIHPFRVSSSGPEEARRLTGLSATGIAAQNGFPLSRSTSDGYEASGGEDSDRVPTRFVPRSTNWTNVLFSSDADERLFKLQASSSGLSDHRKL
ncbi:probable protein S-acyltransferase 22 [Humulus lupulus]|uniref:probable protein S-acyltransferase 22 n=1 Tax=Humulus lupulus TaxID=3486 RepID=UPI002B40B9EC|nr:probable protein S-acyltransferase 22 [Humulus lupulus]XP_062111364.1 probable protein S-acyltransferase 22 [Humulus lupulus]XP_062111365.1 probable protein S-acyltransferase 22 [Humulus lupulus]XP_062111366.1 probable protein S-acyltransferase 22 [Humulus lupulus]